MTLFWLPDSPWRCRTASASWRTVCWTEQRSRSFPERRNTSGTEICRSSSSWNTQTNTWRSSWTHCPWDWQHEGVFVLSDALVIDEHFSGILGESVEIGALDVVIHAGQLKEKHTHSLTTRSHSSHWLDVVIHAGQLLENTHTHTHK